MKTYACDKCGAEFNLEDGDFDDTCPECFSDRTVLLSSEKSLDDSDLDGDDFDDADLDDDY